MPLTILGVLNYTPDSFSDGGRFQSVDQVLARFEQLLEEGADFVDLGCESTRPGAEPLDANIEWERLEPVLELLDERGLLPLTSLDTRHDFVVEKCVGLGLRFFNNVSGLYREATMRAIAENSQASYIAMHMHGEPQTMQLNPLHGSDAVQDVKNFFSATETDLLAYGFTKDRLWFDPGIGFGKNDAANFALLMESRNFSQCYNICIGISRKGFLGRLFGIEEPHSRDQVSKAMELGLWFAGVSMIRTHMPFQIDRVRKLLS